MDFRFASRRFAPAAHWTVAALAGVAVFVMLGRWQLVRAAEKELLFDAFAAGAVQAMPLPAGTAPVERYRRVTATGRYDPSRQFLLDNMTHGGRAGYHVLTPLVVDDGTVLLVNRGFLALAGARDNLPDLAVGAGPRRVTGRADNLPRAALSLDAPAASGWPRVVGFPDMAEIGAALGATMHPQLLLLDAAEPDGFLRDWQPPGMAPEKHLGYAVQWFGLAATVAATWLVLAFKPREGAP